MADETAGANTLGNATTRTGTTSGIDMYGASWCGDCKRAKDALNRFGADFTWHDIEQEDGAEARAIEISGQRHIPVVRFSDGSFLVEPSATEIKGKLDVPDVV